MLSHLKRPFTAGNDAVGHNSLNSTSSSFICMQPKYINTGISLVFNSLYSKNYFLGWLLNLGFVSEKKKSTRRNMRKGTAISVFLLAFLFFSFVVFNPCQGFGAGGSNWKKGPGRSRAVRILSLSFSVLKVYILNLLGISQTTFRHCRVRFYAFSDTFVEIAVY